MTTIHYAKNISRTADTPNTWFTPDVAKEVLAYHRIFPEYAPTPLVPLSDLAKHLGVQQLFVKDESYRFGQNAFKVLGSSYAMGNYIAEKLGVHISQLDYETIVSPATRKRLGDLTFITATDDNHGRGVAWTANRLKQHCVVYLPKGTAVERLENIRALGAEATITDLNYDDAVRLAAQHAKEHGWILIQDTSWDGYEKIPTWIMQGYMTLIEETTAQLKDTLPTHVFLQAGVGALAGSITSYLASYYGDKKPLITIVEPTAADCIYQTARAADGTIHHVGGSLSTIMAGLACGEPCPIAWEVLSRHADYFISMSDHVAAKGMRILGNPLGTDSRIISGESGAAGLGLVTEVLRKEQFTSLKDALHLDSNSVILCISTEGDTDKKGYRKIVWDGE